MSPERIWNSIFAPSGMYFWLSCSAMWSYHLNKLINIRMTHSAVSVAFICVPFVPHNFFLQNDLMLKLCHQPSCMLIFLPRVGIYFIKTYVMLQLYTVEWNRLNNKLLRLREIWNIKKQPQSLLCENRSLWG